MKIIKTKAKLKSIAKELGIELGDRWEKGIDHHPKSMPLIHSISAIDTILFDNYFDWRSGGDGDNGETLAYQLDVIFDFADKGYEVSRTAWQ